MVKIRKPTKKLKEICLQLGPAYSITPITLEYVIYRDLGNGYEFEISGLNNNKNLFDSTIFVWQDKKVQVETISNISSLEELKTTLDKLVDRYSKS